MTDSPPTPICAFAFAVDGIQPLASSASSSEPVRAPGFRWQHFDLAEPGLNPWLLDNVPEIAARALLQGETRPRCDRLSEGLIVNLRGVNLNPEASPEDMVSLRLWILPGKLISTRMRKVFAVDAMREAAASGNGPRDLGGFVAELAYGLAKRIEAVSLEIEETVDGYEEAMLDGQPLAASEISQRRQTTIKLRRYIAPQREALDTLAKDGVDILGEQACQLIRETANRTRRSLEELDAARDRLAAIQDHVDAYQAQKLAQNSYLLSIVASIFLPLGFLTGLFGVNVAGMPGTSDPMAFWWLGAASIGLGLLVYIVLKLSKRI